jgi:PAS domain S-box-containing protein
MNSKPLEPNRRILIIDDNASIHADFKKILCPVDSNNSEVNEMEALIFKRAKKNISQHVFHLDSAFQGQEALEMVKQSLKDGRPYATAFVDVRMPPGWDGIETIARIWEVDPQIQIVICTAYADYSWEEMRGKVGQPDSLLVLKKPFDNIEVQQMAHALTKKWLLNFQTVQQMADLTQANKALAELEERFSKAFHESPVPSGIQSLPDKRFVDVNHRLAQIAGLRREDMIGRSPAELSLWEKPAAAERWYESATGRQLVRAQEGKLREKGGRLHEVLVSLCPLALGEKSHLLLLAEDVSEQALLERQLRQSQKMEAIGQLAAGVAHDFNNILTVIQGHTGMIQLQMEPNSPLRKSLEQISLSTERASALIRQLLMFSRKQVMQFRHVDLNNTLQNVLKMLERLLGETVQVEFHPQPFMPAIYADTSMLEQIAMNLAVNARDAMPNGGFVKILTSMQTIRRGPNALDAQARDGEFICLTFSDNGTGMDTQLINRIFEPFFTTKPAGKGTGLGLSTVLGIVQQHSGWVEVESKPGKGTTFRLYFPKSERPAEKLEKIEETELLKGRETVLVAEDEGALREMVALVLRTQGYTVLEAASGREAIEKWGRSERKVDLLVTDMVMPGGVLGGELAECLQEKCPSLKVIYTSGYSPGMAGKDTSLLEGRNFLPKPYSIGKLAKFVRECLDSPPVPC